MSVPKKTTRTASMPPAKKSASAAVKKQVAKGTSARSTGTAVKKTAVSKAVPPPSRGAANPGGY